MAKFELIQAPPVEPPPPTVKIEMTLEEFKALVRVLSYTYGGYTAPLGFFSCARHEITPDERCVFSQIVDQVTAEGRKLLKSCQ